MPAAHPLAIFTPCVCGCWLARRPTACLSCLRINLEEGIFAADIVLRRLHDIASYAMCAKDPADETEWRRADGLMLFCVPMLLFTSLAQHACGACAAPLAAAVGGARKKRSGTARAPSCVADAAVRPVGFHTSALRAQDIRRIKTEGPRIEDVTLLERARIDGNLQLRPGEELDSYTWVPDDVVTAGGAFEIVEPKWLELPQMSFMEFYQARARQRSARVHGGA